LALKAITLDDLERQNRGFIDLIFWQFLPATHISRANCVEITR